jgi:hypothetical protein
LLRRVAPRNDGRAPVRARISSPDNARRHSSTPRPLSPRGRG